MSSRVQKNPALYSRLERLPDSAGVYLFANARGKVLYIGKAKSLRKRVRSYFQRVDRHDAKTAGLVAQVASVEVIVTDTEVEALILEANLVKEQRPRYNINLKDDKHYPYVEVTLAEPFPRLLIARRVRDNGSRYFGPYANGSSLRKTLRNVTRLFKIRTCNLTIPHPTGRPQKVCLEYHIGRCGGPCAGLESSAEYRAGVTAAMLFLEGKNRKLIEELTARMNAAAEEERFERAAGLRDQIDGIRATLQKQTVDLAKAVDRDVIALALGDGEGVGVVMQIRDGVLIGRQDVRVTPGELSERAEATEEFVTQYYSARPDIPPSIHVSVALPDAALVERWLTNRRGDTVTVSCPKSGPGQSLVGMAESNARLTLEEMLIQKRGLRERPAPMVSALQTALRLPQAPARIVCFDISNTGATDAVGAMSCFVNGRPRKSEYRKFKIKTVRGQDDVAMMGEIVRRYFARVSAGEIERPDLVVIDGGRGQLNAALTALHATNVAEQASIGLAKRLEEIYFPDRSQPITLSKTSPALMLLKQVRDEAHRFGVAYNRKTRAKRTLTSQLDSIPGIGPARRNALLKKFGSVSAIGRADADEIAQTPGITKPLATSVKASLAGARKSAESA